MRGRSVEYCIDVLTVPGRASEVFSHPGSEARLAGLEIAVFAKPFAVLAVLLAALAVDWAALALVFAVLAVEARPPAAAVTSPIFLPLWLFPVNAFHKPLRKSPTVLMPSITALPILPITRPASVTRSMPHFANCSKAGMLGKNTPRIAVATRRRNCSISSPPTSASR